MPQRRRSDPLGFLRPGPDLALEEARWAVGLRRVAGIDEAGRGPLAGPVVAAAVVLDPARVPAGLDDSKKLTAAARERLFEAILISGAAVAFAQVGALEIDRLNIRRATLEAMRLAASALFLPPDHCLVDGVDVPPELADRATAVVGGDARSLSIAAASIVAKVARDRLMRRLGEAFPAYGFERHMGYGTKAHLDAIAAHGPSPHHRRSFAPVRNALPLAERG